LLGLTFFVTICYAVEKEITKKYPCDPKFGYSGNYLEFTIGSNATKLDQFLSALVRKRIIFLII